MHMRMLLYVYALMSVVTLVAYAVDKLAAVRGAWRISERTLHTLEFLFGWPGAWLAQQLFRHKSSKREYRVVFCLMVVLNIALVWLLRRFGR